MTDRRRPPTDRMGKTYKMVFQNTREDGTIFDQRVYLTVNIYEDGSPCEMFFTLDKTGSTARGLLDCWAIAASMLIQCGQLQEVIDKFRGQRFPPNSFKYASVIDWAMQILEGIVKEND